MGYNRNFVLHTYLANMYLDPLIAVYGKCPHTWGETDIITSINRIYYITDGVGFITVNGETIYPQKGDMVLIPSGVRLSFGTMNGEAYTKYWCHFAMECANTGIFEFVKLPFMVHVGENEHLLSIFRTMAEGNDKNDVLSAFQTQSCLMQILTIFIQIAQQEGNVLAVTKNRQMQDVMVFIEKNYRKEITIHDLSERAHLHPNYFIKTFKKQFGMTPMQYVNNLRLEKSRQLLSATSESIQEIATMCGYSDQFQFSKAFKKMFDISPSSYRRFHSI